MSRTAVLAFFKSLSLTEIPLALAFMGHSEPEMFQRQVQGSLSGAKFGRVDIATCFKKKTDDLSMPILCGLAQRAFGHQAIGLFHQLMPMAQ